MGRVLADLDWPRRTARLSLRPAQAEDAAAVFAYRSLPEVSAFLRSLPTDPVAHAAAFAETQRHCLVIERDGEVIGDLYLRVQDAWSQAEVADQAVGTQAEIGWAIRPEDQRQGYAYEATHELLRIGFEDLGVRRIEAACFADNPASWRLMDKLGLRREGYYVKESLHRSGRWMDGIQYALLAEEWHRPRSGPLTAAR